jgi:dihydropteroate synthase
MQISMVDGIFSSRKTLNIKGQVLDLSVPAVMGILNITPDSFYDGGYYTGVDQAVARAAQMFSEGATFIDIGGYSSRPGAYDVSAEEELERIIPVVSAVKKTLPEVFISIDTFRAVVAREAVAAGADIINDISGGEMDSEMFQTVAALQVPYILMHMRGTPQTMKGLTAYDDLIQEMIDYFQKKIHILHGLNVKDIILDPGFGFAKTISQNYELLRNLNYFKVLNLPVLAGVSRKSMIHKKLAVPVEESLNGTTVLNTVALMNGAGILRVHDVKEAVQAVKLLNLVYH